MTRKIFMLLLFFVFSSTSFAADKIGFELKSLSERVAAIKFDKKPTLRSLLSVSLFDKSKIEIDGIMSFVKENQLNLDSSVDLVVRDERVFIFGKELKFNSQTQTYSFDGHMIQPSQKPLDILIRDIFHRINPGQFSLVHLIIPAAEADEISSAISKVRNAGATALLIGVVTSMSPIRTEFWLTASKYLIRGGGIAYAGSLIAGCLFSNDAAAPEMIFVDKASCDKNGMNFKTGKKTVEMRLDREGVKLLVTGVAGDTESTYLKGDNLVSAKELLTSCASKPIPPEELKTTLQSAITKKLIGASEVSNTGSAAKQVIPAASTQ